MLRMEHTYGVLLDTLLPYCMPRAVGNKMYGTKYHENLVETLRRTAELCDCLQSFFLLHSMGGGGWSHMIVM